MTDRIALATAAEFPDLDEDGPGLISALDRVGLAGEPAIWTDEGVDWASYAAVVVRATWDYFRRRDDFVRWADRVEAATVLANPAAVLRWNTDKTYLRQLAQAGLPVVATEWLVPGDEVRLPAEGEYVVKPAVSAGSNDTSRYVAGTHDDEARAHAELLLGQGRTVMVQPYLDDVDSAGETALLYFSGEFSHAIRKGPMLQLGMGPVEGAYRPELITPRQPSAAEHDVATRVLDTASSMLGLAPRDFLYARVDLIPGPDGTPTLLELELAEPSMFLVHDEPAAADRFAGAIAALVRPHAAT